MRQTPSWARTKVKHDSTLGIGLPFLMSHTPSAIRAVVAHELSHLHRNDAVFIRIYLYILRLSTKLSHNAIEAKHYLVFIIFSGGFYIWFSPLFYMYFYALSRSNEYKADMMKSDVEGIEPAAIELLSTAVHKSYISKVIWPQINRLAVTHTNLPVGTFERMCDMFTEGPSRDQTTRWLRKALSATTKADDTHPCLVDRLRNIGYEDITKDRFVEDFELPQLKNPKNKDTITDVNNSASTNAARYYFGERLSWICRVMEERWMVEKRTTWQNRHYHFSKRMSRLRELSCRDHIYNADEYSLIEEADLMSELYGPEASVPFYRSILQQYPECMGASKNLGMILLDKDDPEGERLLKDVMKKNIKYITQISDLLQSYYTRNGRYVEAAEALKTAAIWKKKLAALERKAKSVNQSSMIKAHKISDDTIKSLINYLTSTVPGVLQIYLYSRNSGTPENHIQTVLWVVVHEDKIRTVQTVTSKIIQTVVYYDVHYLEVRNKLTNSESNALNPAFLIWDDKKCNQTINMNCLPLFNG